jgi:hypothetical protein
MSQSASQKLEFAFQRNDGIAADLEWLSTGDHVKSLSLLARGEAKLVLNTKPDPAPEVEIGPIIRVDRSTPPVYPDWMQEVMHPELEAVGPAEYDVSALEQWLHEGQKDGKYVEGNKIYADLKKSDTLKDCLGLRDLEDIQRKGIVFFQKYFKGKAVFGWKGSVRRHYGNLNIPYLHEIGDQVALHWHWAGTDWDGNHPALRFARSTNSNLVV